MGKAARIRKTRAEVEDPEAPDRFISGYSKRRADVLRAHCADAIRELGYRPWDRGSHIVITGGPFNPPGATLGLSTISREAARVPESVWHDLVADVIGQLITSALAAPPRLGRSELREKLFPRFSSPGRIPEGQLEEDYTYARRIGGMPLLLAVRNGQASALLADSHLGKAGGADAAWEAAEANLFAAGLGDPTAYAAPSGAAVIVLESEHPRQAAWLAHPDRLMEMLGLEIGPLGVLFCVPAHRILGFHVLSERTSRQDLERMRELTAILGAEEVAPLSKELFWWAPGMSVTNRVPPSVLDALCSSDPVPFDTMDE